MTTRNDALTPSDGAGRRDDLIDGLLTELKDDQGGARKTALRRALDVDNAAGSNASADVEARLDSIEDRLDDLETDVDARLDSLEGRVLDLEEDAEAAAEWRESLQRALQ
ncbi:hypothetical protein [Salinilacihabitans rarus]|uniref:hypothetical protein n=1 Tax=Salinilacihabitans rarus TaxID=2961596 RepID=UPI0020C93969|nr:hypothetical protein [Salinilacihabitans rarus]